MPGHHLLVPILRCGSAGLALAAAATACVSSSDSARSEPSSTHRRPSGKPMMFVRDPDDFARKWKKFSTDRLDKLVVIADFDYTLTPAYKPTGSWLHENTKLKFGSNSNY
jgi:hypothetical protein